MYLNERDFDYEEQLSIKNQYQAGFKLLAIVSFMCALFVCASFIWLLVCRSHRLPTPDERIKKDAAYGEHTRQKIGTCHKRKRNNLRKKLKNLFFRQLRIRPPSPSLLGDSDLSLDSSRSEEEDKKSKKKNKGKK